MSKKIEDEIKKFYNDRFYLYIRLLEIITCLHIIANCWRHW